MKITQGPARHSVVFVSSSFPTCFCKPTVVLRGPTHLGPSIGRCRWHQQNTMDNVVIAPFFLFFPSKFLVLNVIIIFLFLVYFFKPCIVICID